MPAGEGLMGEPTADRLTAARTALMIVDMQRYFVHPDTRSGNGSQGWSLAVSTIIFGVFDTW